MILAISKDIRITSDHCQWIIQKRRSRKRNGKLITEWQSHKFYPTFEGTVRELGEGMVRESDAVGFAEALVEVERICATLSQALPTHLQVISTTEELTSRFTRETA